MSCYQAIPAEWYENLITEMKLSCDWIMWRKFHVLDKMSTRKAMPFADRGDVLSRISKSRRVFKLWATMLVRQIFSINVLVVRCVEERREEDLHATEVCMKAWLVLRSSIMWYRSDHERCRSRNGWNGNGTWNGTQAIPFLFLLWLLFSQRSSSSFSMIFQQHQPSIWS